MSCASREVLGRQETKCRVIMLNEVLRVLKYSSVVLSAQYAVFLVTCAILKRQKAKLDMSVLRKLNKKDEEEHER